MPEEQRQFVTLDGLRGVAAVTVVTRHAPIFFASVSVYSDSAARIPLGPFFESYLAVDFFFALSGFVLAYAYEPRFRAGMTAAHFAALRLIRLYPLYLVALVISAFVRYWEVLHDGFSPKTAGIESVSALLFMPSLAGSAILFPLNVPAWSLFFELAANVLFALGVWRLSNRALSAFVMIAGAIMITGVLGEHFGFGPPTRGAMEGGWEFKTVGEGLVRVLFSFFCGVWIFRFWKRRVAPVALPPFLIAAVLAAILVSHPAETYRKAFDLCAVLFGFPLLIWLGASSTPHPRSESLYAFLGTVSYAVYVLQAPLYNFVSSALRIVDGTRDYSLLWGIGFTMFVIAVASMIDATIDFPIRRILTRWLAKSRTKTDSPQTVS
jgi:peptidoglycan/LPS O-acetylase OafA/YrhL